MYLIAYISLSIFYLQAEVPCVKENWVIERICVDPGISLTCSTHHYKLIEAEETDA